MHRACGFAAESAARRLLFAVCLSSVLLLPTPAAGGDARLLRVGTSGDYPPFSESIEAAPGLRGFDISVARAFARDRGYRIEWVEFAWPQLLADMRAERFDLAMSGITVRRDRSAAGRFSVPVMTSGAVLLYAASAFEGEGPDALAAPAEALARFDRPGVRVAVNRGGHLERVTRAHFARAAIRAIPDNLAVRQALVDARADVVVTDSLEAPVWLEGLARVSKFGPFTRDRKAYWVAASRIELSRELDAWLLAREGDGTLARLRLAAFAGQGHEETARPLSALLAAIDERLSLMPWVAESKRRSGAAVEDRAQELRVVEAGLRSVRAAARRAAVPAPPAAAVRGFYLAQIEAAKAIQRRTLSAAVQLDARASELKAVLRPALMRIGDRMAQLIVAFAQPQHSPALAGDLAGGLVGKVERALAARGLDEARVEEIRLSLAALAGNAS